METSPLACPVCGHELVLTDLGGIPVATCHEHGRWIDHEAAKDLVEGLEKEIQKKSQSARRRTRRLIRKRREERERSSQMGFLDIFLDD